MPLDKSALSRLADVLGKDNLWTDEPRRQCYAYDAAGGRHLPDAVALAIDEDQVAGVIRLANEKDFPVVPRGAGTGMTGGAVAVSGGLVLCLSRMDRILNIDAANLVADAEPGVVTGHFHREVEKLGLFYPPDPSSSGYSTLGGNVAECAGGPRAVKYGVTRDWVLGLRAVTGAGEVIRTGVRTAKGVVGYDLTRLLVGSEGTLAVVTGITLRLTPLPSAVRTVTAVFDRMATATAAVARVFAAGIVPRAMEFMDQASLKCAEEAIHAGLPVDAGGVLLLEVDGTATEADREAQRLAEVCREAGARQATASGGPEAKKLWEARKAISPALFRYGPHKINEDIVVPVTSIPEMVETVERLAEETGLTMVCFGHAGDGNIHFNIMLDKNDPKAFAQAGEAIRKVFEKVLSLGGTLSGEHGVGITKSPFVSMEISGPEIRLMRAVKDVFDPRGILNPGKIFPPGS
ncbi:MAG: FAD-binding protein [Proteobacteria bacterium]|nr:FAD-binding protein [Pseudomonadota bacterium]